MKNPELDTICAIQFSHYRYSYPGNENGPSHEAQCQIAAGREIVVVDRNCESHFIPFKAKFIEYVGRGQYGHDYMMLCQATEDNDCGGKKGEYWLVLPVVRHGMGDSDLMRGGKPRGVELTLEFQGAHNLGKNRYAKVIVQEAKTL